MSKKANKKLIKEAIKAQVNEGPLDVVRGAAAGAKGAGAGVAGAFRGMKANYHLNNVSSQLNQFADKVEKVWNIHEPKIRKSANKLSVSKDKNARDMGSQISSQVDNYQKNVRSFANKVRSAAPGSQLSAQGRPASGGGVEPIQAPQNMPSYDDQKQQLGQFSKDKQKPNFRNWLADQGLDFEDLDTNTKKELIQQFRMSQMRKAGGDIAPDPQASSVGPMASAPSRPVANQGPSVASKVASKVAPDMKSAMSRVAGSKPSKKPHPGSEEDLKSVIQRAASGFAKKPGKYKSKGGKVGKASPVAPEPAQPIPLVNKPKQQNLTVPQKRVSTQKMGTVDPQSVFKTEPQKVRVQDPPQDYSNDPAEPQQLKKPSAKAVNVKRPSARAKVKKKSRKK